MDKNSKLKKLIDKNQSLSISRFINLCLYEKKYGYYHNKVIGSDFTTSPEISQLFGECVSIFFTSVIQKIGIIKNFYELGSGNGTLAKDLVKTLNKLNNFEFNLFIHEKSENLNLDSLNDLAEVIFLKKKKRFILPMEPIFFIGNEFFDSLPVNQFEKTKNSIFERRISYNNNKFKIFLKESPHILLSDKNYKNGDIIEDSPQSKLYLKKIFKHLKVFGEGLLIFDYGPFKKKNISTIQAIHTKKKSCFLDFPYESDITYHIDFEAIKNLSKKFNLNFYGPITQKKFLYFNGINERLENLKKNSRSKKVREDLNSQFLRLTDPFGMGDLIKCVYIAKNKINLDYFNYGKQ